MDKYYLNNISLYYLMHFFIYLKKIYNRFSEIHLFT